MTESEKPLEGEAADVERSRLRDERVDAQGAVGVSWRNQFLRCFDGEDDDER